MQGYETRAFRGLGVFVSMPYEVSDDQDSVQMLQRSSQVGEFYRMMPPAVWNKNKVLPSQYLDLLIYDEEMDQLKHIDFEQALLATGADVGARLDLVTLLTGIEGAPGTTAFRNLLPRGPILGKTPEESTAAGEARDALTNNPITLPRIIDAVKKGVWLPVCITLVRPFIEHLMMSTVCTVSGRDTGATLFGPADMQISANTSVKTIEGHYTYATGPSDSNSMPEPLDPCPACTPAHNPPTMRRCHTKSVITKPQNVYVMRDVMCSGYVAGGNTRFFGTPAGQTRFPGVNDPGGVPRPANAADIQRSLNERLSFADDSSGEYASMLAFLSPFTDEINSSRDQVISISDRLLPWEVAKNADPEKKYFPGGKVGWSRYAAEWNLGQIHFGEDVRSTENMAFMSQGAVNNSLAMVGPHRRYNPFAQNFFELVPGQGHFGPDAIPGDARWRRGESVSLKTARDSMVSLEVAAHSQLALRPANGL